MNINDYIGYFVMWFSIFAIFGLLCDAVNRVVSIFFPSNVDNDLKDREL